MAGPSWKASAGLFIAGTAAYLTALVITWPATYLDQEIRTATEDTIRLVHASGTVWSGHAELEIRRQGKALAQPIPVSWQFQPRMLAQAGLGFSVLAEGNSRPALLNIGFSSTELRDLTLTLPASTLALMAEKLVSLEPRGILLLRVDRMIIGGKQPAADMQMEWRNAASGMTDVAPLGDYRIHGLMREGQVSVVVDTIKGPLLLEGQGRWPQGSPPAFQGTAKVSAELRSKLAPMLRLIATERAAGEFEVRLK